MLAAIAVGAGLAQGEAVAELAGTGRPGAVGGEGIARGVALVRCAGEAPNTWRQSRVFVLDVGGSVPNHDLMLAVAHGLPTDVESIKQDCALFGVNGPPETIAAVWLPTLPRSLGNDWAIVMSSRPLAGAVGRLQTAVVEPRVMARLVHEEAAFKLELLSDNQDQGRCTLLGAHWMQGSEVESGLFAHSCRTRPGLSGSPIIVAVDGEPVVVGINLGRRLRPPKMDGPLFYGVGRVIDDEIAAAIRHAVDFAASAPAPLMTGRR